MRKFLPVVVAIAITFASGPLGAQKRAKKPVQKPVSRATKGTTQLAGDNGKIGVTYTLGKGGDAINFTLLSAEYSAARIVQTNTFYVPGEDEKFLVLHFTLHNPNPSERSINWATLRFTAIDSKDVNHTNIGNGGHLFMKEGTTEDTGLNLKPAQKIAIQTAITVPADASVPKLMVEIPDVTPVLRIYFKPGEIKSVSAPWADAADKIGCVAVKNPAAGPGIYLPAYSFDVKYVSSTYVDKFENRETGENKQYFVATFTVKNQTLEKRSINWATFQTSVKTDDGERTPIGANALTKPRVDEQVNTEVLPGDEYTFRIPIEIAKGAKVTEIRLREEEGTRTLIYKVP